MVAAATIVVGVLPGGAARADTVSTQLSVAASRSVVTYGHEVTFSGRLMTATQTPLPVSGAEVHLQRRAVGAASAWTVVGSDLTDDQGRVSVARELAASADYRLRYPGSATDQPTVSPVVPVGVRHRVRAELSTAAARVGREVTVSGSVAPPHSGRRVRLERYLGGAWQRADSATLRANGGYIFKLSFSSAGYRSYRVVMPADRSHLQGAARLPRLDIYRLHRYVVRTRGDIRTDLPLFRASVAETYADPRGWRRAHHRFARVPSGGDFTVLLAQARYLPTYSPVCSTFYSCRVGDLVIINQNRWRLGSPYFPGPLPQYQRMLVNHETGHWLGQGHSNCSRSGRSAPVMQQQSKGMQGCRPNAWPLAWEVRSAKAD